MLLIQLRNYLVKIGFYDFVKNEAKKAKSDPAKRISNVEDLLNMVGYFDSIEEFFINI
jgi:hypothetical protein